MQPNRKIGEKQDEMGRSLGKNGCKQTSKDSRGGKTSRTQEKGKATAEIRMDASKRAKTAEVEKHQGRRKRGRPQLRWEDCVRRDMRRSGEDERWREGAADRKLWKERTERVARQYFT